ncbi:hypothetical protein NG895_16325 [Aeoliella sp. ICT_H6.2]|uniref:DUF4251 domain-containing protein n=1 Tax=Aeoliella straminimaris TaxID=2954799 RepID=A0A9X2JIA0_9BACT|nr:hypothetical protein [Aeoliella straminimaris]MCO6045478.1 hypothetical protein [Aeoliella straminimaris]
MGKRHQLLAATLALLLAAPAMARELPEKEIKEKLKKGGQHWSVTDKAFSGFRQYDQPGDLLYFWPAEDKPVTPGISEKGGGSYPLKVKWQLRDGQTFPPSKSKYLTYLWGEPGEKAYGFQVVKIDKSATSGSFTISLSFSKGDIEKIRKNHDIVLLFLAGKEVGGNFLKCKARLP